MTPQVFLKPIWFRPNLGKTKLAFLLAMASLLVVPQAHAILINVVVDPATSILSYTVGTPDFNRSANLPSINYRIRGSVSQVSAGFAPSAYASVSTLNLQLKNGANILPVQIGGTIGGLPVSTTPVAITISLTTPAVINLTGDLDESAITPTKPAGAYSGSLTVLVTLL